jgi:hypothetical protein
VRAGKRKISEARVFSTQMYFYLRLQAIAFDAYRYNILHSQHANRRKSLVGRRRKLKARKRPAKYIYYSITTQIHK